MIIITILCLLLITYYHSIKDIIILIYYSDILYNIERSTKNCYKKYNLYENKYNYSLILDVINYINAKKNKDAPNVEIKVVNEGEIKDAPNVEIKDVSKDVPKVETKVVNEGDIYSNPIAKELYYFLKDKDIYNYYNGVSGTLLSLFVVLFILFIIYNKFNNKYNNIYIFIVLYIIAYIIIFPILSDKIKRYNDKINSKEYNINTDNLRYDLEEFRKLIYSHIGHLLILVFIIMILYKNLYGEYNYYIAYGIFITSIIITYLLYFVYIQSIL